MKKYFTSTVFLFLFCAAFSQTDAAERNRYEFGFRSGVYATMYAQAPTYAGYFTARKGIHELAIGPSVGRSSGFYNSMFLYYPAGPYKLNGIDIAYRILPNGPGKVFDFYFQVDYFQKWNRIETVDYIDNFPSIYGYPLDNLEARSRTSMLLIEYGFDVKFLRYFYVGTSLAIGGGIDFQKYTYETYTQANSTAEKKNVESMLRVNLGVRF